MTEEVDLDMTAVWEALENGQRMIEEEEHKERQEKERFEKALEEAKRLLFGWLPDAIQPYAKLIDLEVVESEYAIRPDFGWLAVKVPNLALITAYVKQGTPPEITYWVHDPAVVSDEIGLDDDWDRTVVYRKLEDYRVALARAYDVMRKHMWNEHGSVPDIPADNISDVRTFDRALSAQEIKAINESVTPIQDEINKRIDQRVLEKIKIEEVIEQNYGWKLIKHNEYLIAPNDRSLIVDPDRQIYYWNSQGETGDVIHWVQKREKLSTRDAISHLVDLYQDRFVATTVEPHYEPFCDDLIDSDGQFDGPVAALWTEYKLHELVRLIGQVVDRKLATR